MMWNCYKCGGEGDRLSLVNTKERTVAITCVEHNRFERVSFEDVPESLLSDLEYLIETANDVENKEVLA